MAGCCGDCGGAGLDPREERQRRTLWWVLGINSVMFVVIAAAALIAGSNALLSDSLDDLGDSLTYAISLWAVGKSGGAKARVALFKGLLILAAALFVLGRCLFFLLDPRVPVFETMGAFALLALAANLVCLALLYRHRNEDLNMSSVFECSRNDIAVNLSVFAAAFGVWATGSAWPDLVIALGLVVLLLRSSGRVLLASFRGIRKAGEGSL